MVRFLDTRVEKPSSDDQTSLPNQFSINQPNPPIWASTGQRVVGGIDGSGISQGESVRSISQDPELSGSGDRVPWGSNRLLRCGSGFTNIPAFRSSLSLLRSSFFNRRGSVESEGGIQFNEWYPSSWVLPIDPSGVINERWLLPRTVGHPHHSRFAGEGGAG